MQMILEKIDAYLSHKKDYTYKDVDFLDAFEVIHENHIFTLHHFASETHTRNTIIIPSLVNGPEILYLNHNFNIIKSLSQKSNIYLVKWKNINEHNKHYDLNSYVNEISELLASFGPNIHLVGHCLGGNIAFGAAYLNQDLVSKLTLLTTGWDFSHFNIHGMVSIPPTLLSSSRAKRGDLSEIYRKTPVRPGLPRLPRRSSISSQRQRKWCWVNAYHGMEIFENYDSIPAIFLEIMFFMRDSSELTKRLNRSDELSWKIEKWLHSGNNMAKNTFFQIMRDFAQKNILERNEWYINKIHINPSKFPIETLFINGKNDKIVPLSSSMFLYEKLPNAKMQIMDSGHIGYLLNPQFISFLFELIHP
jgi:poly(3-hydroxyalkanoate) synthetase